METASDEDRLRIATADVHVGRAAIRFLCIALVLTGIIFAAATYTHYRDLMVATSLFGIVSLGALILCKKMHRDDIEELERLSINH